MNNKYGETSTVCSATTLVVVNTDLSISGIRIRDSELAGGNASPDEGNVDDANCFYNGRFAWLMVVVFFSYCLATAFYCPGDIGGIGWSWWSVG